MHRRQRSGASAAARQRVVDLPTHRSGAAACPLTPSFPHPVATCSTSFVSDGSAATGMTREAMKAALEELRMHSPTASLASTGATTLTAGV